MIIFSAATAGSNRTLLEDTVLKRALKNGKKLKVINFIDEMIKSAKNLNKYINSSALPNLDIKTLEILKNAAFHNIVDTIKEDPNTDYIVDGHMSFWWKSGPISLLNVNDFREFTPDFFITAIASPKEVLDSLKVKKEWTDKEIDSYEIAIWSELEIYTADLISEALNRKNYLIAVNEDPITLYDLIYAPSKPKVYISFSMEHRTTSYEQLDRFITKLKNHSIVFNPRSIDLDVYRSEDDERLKAMVFNQTVRRDYHLIDQSDLVVVHMSSLVYSSGVDSERMHAHTNGKPVLLYFPFDRYSPFTPYFVDKMYKKEGDIIRDVAKLHKEAKGNGRGVKR
ncbi:MAG: ATP-binding protein [Candidatus Parvarchaeota archaeon]|nr:ATP-binding protein [Candidatus Parvarchaeota archaeon]MCL5101486.1 ATP-binding protein [Candidatus Parvarchaeota archaeon]